jgi:hypothetical protein
VCAARQQQADDESQARILAAQQQVDEKNAEAQARIAQQYPQAQPQEQPAYDDGSPGDDGGQYGEDAQAALDDTSDDATIMGSDRLRSRFRR